MARRKTAPKKTTKKSSAKVRVYTLEIFIVGGPMTDRFLERNRVVSRKIEIRGDQTLQDFHRGIFDAFDREDEHMYEFQVGGKGPMDPKARRYVLRPSDDTGPDGTRAGDVRRTASDARPC